LHHKLVQGLGASTVLATTLSNALATQMPMVVVTTEPLAELVSRHVATRDMVVLPGADSAPRLGLGMGYSIAAGVAARSDASGWLILPADMPMVQTSTLQLVANELDHHAIAYAQYLGRRGHPVGFAAELYSELVMLTGDEGARRLVARYPAQGVEVDDPGVLLDVDTEDDLARVRVAQQEMQFREAR
jgi:molybdenum cofactor cytidylyltransferase